jgi:predicted house-cleaning noncanonical NTP pyrophosphatase (MazG superfamily)
MKKLVRDHYYDIIDHNRLEKLTDVDETKHYLYRKLHEEINELVESDFKDIEEYADIITVLYRLASLNNIHKKDIEESYEEKIIKLGGFKLNLLFDNLI